MVQPVPTEGYDEGWETPPTVPSSSQHEHGEEQSEEGPSRGSDLCRRAGKCMRCACMTSVCAFLCIVVFALYSLFQIANYPASGVRTVQDENGNVYMEDDGDGFDLFDLFGMREHIQEVPIDLSLEQIYAGYSTEYPLSVNRACPSCGGQGGHTHHCPYCGGSGMIRTPRGMAYCPHCQGHGVIMSGVCEMCHGTGVIAKDFSVPIAIPPGAPDKWSHVYKLNDGSKVRFRVHQLPHSSFERQDADLVMHIHLSLKEALLGTTIPITTIDKQELQVVIPPCSVQPFGTIRKAGYGLPRYEKNAVNGITNLFKGKRGDLLLIVDIDFPDALDDDQRGAIQTLF